MLLNKDDAIFSSYVRKCVPDAAYALFKNMYEMSLVFLTVKFIKEDVSSFFLQQVNS